MCSLPAAGPALAGLHPNPLYQVGDTPIRAHVVDLNGEGRPDVVSANDVSNDLTVLLADASGNLRHIATLGPVDVDRFWHTGIAHGTFNGDSFPDLVVGTADPEPCRRGCVSTPTRTSWCGRRCSSGRRRCFSCEDLPVRTGDDAGVVFVSC